MKLLTVCIPCHNSIENMHKSITSCLLLKEEIEVLIVDNCSQDETLSLAKEYEAQYPDTIRVIADNKKEFALSQVIDQSQGLYFKLLKSGDYFDQPSLVSVIETLRDFIRIQANLDLLITDHKYICDHKKEQKVSYHHVFPTDTLFAWHGIKVFKKHFLVDLPSAIIKTSILKNIKGLLDEEQFLPVYIMYGIVPYIKSMYYLPTYFYCCDGEKKVILHELDDYMALLKKLWNVYDVFSLKSRRQRNFAIEQLSKIYIAIEYLVFKNGEKEKKNELDVYLQESHYKLFKALTYNLFGTLLNIDNKKARGLITRVFEKLYQNIE